jgi:hypothetical protein
VENWKSEGKEGKKGSTDQGGIQRDKKDLRRERQTPSHQRQDGRERRERASLQAFDGVAVLLPFSCLVRCKRQIGKGKVRFVRSLVFNKFKSSPSIASIVSHVRNGPRLSLPLFPILPHPPLADGARDVM